MSVLSLIYGQFPWIALVPRAFPWRCGVGPSLVLWQCSPVAMEVKSRSRERAEVQIYCCDLLSNAGVVNIHSHSVYDKKE